MMRYESKKTEAGNVGVSYTSQSDADDQATQMDNNGCTDCMDRMKCSNCSNCTYWHELFGVNDAEPS